MEAGVADGLGVKIGDAVTLNVLGREVTARVANLRRVDWRSFAINFVFVFSPNTFKGAPYTGLFTAALPPADGAAAESALMKAAARDFPAVAAIRVREALATIEALTAKLALAIRAASGVALASAAIVLAGALAASRRARIADAVILKILGATRPRLIAAFLAEYAAARPVRRPVRRGGGRGGRLRDRRLGDGLRLRLRRRSGARRGRGGAGADGRRSA